MTVKELIAQLSGLPGDSRVLVQGYEDGVFIAECPSIPVLEYRGDEIRS